MRIGPPFSPPGTYCVNHLRYVTLALHNYHHDEGCFPPAYIPDEDGKPMHSWRVLILPYLEQRSLYEQYDFSEPWDGPNNSRLAAEMPRLYRCWRNRSGTASNTTNFVAVVGPKTAWPGSKPMRLAGIDDGTNNTILLIEIRGSKINWMEPRDTSLEEVLSGLNPESGPGLLSAHESDDFRSCKAFAPMSFADGSCGLLPDNIPPDALEALLTVDGGETVDRDRHELWARQRKEEEKRWRFKGFTILALVLSVAVLLGRPWLRAAFRRRDSPSS